MTAQERLGKLGTVAVDVDVELGRIEMTIAEVLRLRPGSVLHLTTGPSSDMTIRAGGALIGECEPVRLDRRAGVRITKVLRAEEAL